MLGKELAIDIAKQYLIIVNFYSYFLYHQLSFTTAKK